jgi:starvation-inducible DNA-binding protein
MTTLDFTKLDTTLAKNVASELQKLLADFQVFYSNIRGFHWNVKGKQFFALHAKFEEMYNNSSEKADEIAERILMLGETPEHKFSEYLKLANIKETATISAADEIISILLETYKHLIASERAILTFADAAGDEATSALMSDYIREQEKTVWMLVAYSK